MRAPAGRVCRMPSDMWYHHRTGVSLCLGDQRRLLTGINYFGFEVATTF